MDFIKFIDIGDLNLNLGANLHYMPEQKKKKKSNNILVTNFEEKIIKKKN